MKKLVFLFLSAVLAVAAPQAGSAQSKTAPKSASAVPAAASDQYVMRNGEVGLRQGSRITPLTKNVVLSNGTKINYKSGIVEFTTGKKTTLREGDYVTITGDIVFASPASAGAARGDNTVPADAKFDKYVEKSPAAVTVQGTAVSTTNTPNDLTSLLTRKIQLLTDKINLMTPNPANQAALDNINQQLQALDAQIGR